MESNGVKKSIKNLPPFLKTWTKGWNYEDGMMKSESERKLKRRTTDGDLQFEFSILIDGNQCHACD